MCQNEILRFGSELLKMNRFFKDIKKFFNYTVFSSKAELKSEVAGSFLSWLWWILDPFFLVLTVGSSSARLLKAA